MVLRPALPCDTMTLGVLAIFILGLLLGIGVALYVMGMGRNLAAKQRVTTDDTETAQSETESNSPAVTEDEEESRPQTLEEMNLELSEDEPEQEDERIEADDEDRAEPSSEGDSDPAIEETAAAEPDLEDDLFSPEKETSTQGDNPFSRQPTKPVEESVDEADPEDRTESAEDLEWMDADGPEIPESSGDAPDEGALLQGLTGNVSESVFRLEDSVVRLGRSPDNDLQIPAGSVSREHCRFRLEGDSYLVEPLSTTNGTCVNGEEVAPGNPVGLEDGDLLQLGAVLFHYRVGSGIAEGDDEPSPDAIRHTSHAASTSPTVTVNAAEWKSRIERELELADGDRRVAAQVLGLEESELELLVDKLGLDA